MRRYRHDLLLIAVCVVSPEKGDMVIIKGDETMVGDSHAVCIASQVAQNQF